MIYAQIYVVVIVVFQLVVLMVTCVIQTGNSENYLMLLGRTFFLIIAFCCVLPLVVAKKYPCFVIEMIMNALGNPHHIRTILYQWFPI